MCFVSIKTGSSSPIYFLTNSLNQLLVKSLVHTSCFCTHLSEKSMFHRHLFHPPGTLFWLSHRGLFFSNLMVSLHFLCTFFLLSVTCKYWSIPQLVPVLSPCTSLSNLIIWITTYRSMIVTFVFQLHAGIWTSYWYRQVVSWNLFQDVQ